MRREAQLRVPVQEIDGFVTEGEVLVVENHPIVPGLVIVVINGARLGVRAADLVGAVKHAVRYGDY